MAQNEGGNGKGISKFRTAEDDAAARRKARANKRRNRTGNKGGTDTPLFGDTPGQTGNQTGLSRVGAERAERIRRDEERARFEAERELYRAEKLAAERTAAIDKAYADTLGHLTRFGNKLVPGNMGMRPRWSVNTAKEARDLLCIYFYGSPVEIEPQEMRVGERIVAEVRRRFASACYFDSTIQGTIGQELGWFKEAFEAAAAFHSERKAQLAVERAEAKAAPANPALAEAIRAMANA